MRCHLFTQCLHSSSLSPACDHEFVTLTHCHHLLEPDELRNSLKTSSKDLWRSSILIRPGSSLSFPASILYLMFSLVEAIAGIEENWYIDRNLIPHWYLWSIQQGTFTTIMLSKGVDVHGIKISIRPMHSLILALHALPWRLCLGGRRPAISNLVDMCSYDMVCLARVLSMIPTKLWRCLCAILLSGCD